MGEERVSLRVVIARHNETRQQNNFQNNFSLQRKLDLVFRLPSDFLYNNIIKMTEKLILRSDGDIER
jgi:hypothetical protein